MSMQWPNEQKAVLTHKTINKCTPPYSQGMVTYKKWSFRDFGNKLNVPQPPTEYLKRSFSYIGASYAVEQFARISSVYL